MNCYTSHLKICRIDKSCNRSMNLVITNLFCLLLVAGTNNHKFAIVVLLTFSGL